MKVRIINKGNIALEKSITNAEFKKFGEINKDVWLNYIFGMNLRSRKWNGFSSGFVIALFDFLFKINISNYEMSDVIVRGQLEDNVYLFGENMEGILSNIQI